MPSSSLFLRSSATLISVLSLFSASASAADSTRYTNVKSYSGNGFYDGFNFFTDADPTHGFVTYVDKNTAMNSGLTRLEDGAFRMGVDSDNVYDPNSKWYGNNGYGRPSVRLESKDSWTKGLFIIDILHMPGNVCGVWPAFWTTVAANTWPVGGEIDIVESISNRDISMAVLHTNGQSVINNDKSAMSGTVQTTDCRYDTATGSNAAGCAIANTNPSEYGSGLNNNGGRIFAMEWADDTVKVWSFPRNNYPSDIDSGNPDPSKWGLPVQNFFGDDANIKDNFFNHKIVINTDFCGDFGSAVWTGEGCAADTGYTTCEAFVANNPAAFVDQFWKINSLKVFQRAAVPTTSSTTSSATTTSSTIRSTRSSSITTTTTTTTSASTTGYTTSSGFTTVTLSTSSSATTSAATTSGTTTYPFSRSTRSSSYDTTSSYETTVSTSSYSFGTSRGFTYHNSSSTAPYTTSTTFSRYYDGTTTSDRDYTTTTTASYTTSTLSWTTSTDSSSTSSSTTKSRSVSATIISATGFPGYAQGGSKQTQNWADWAAPDPTPTFIKTTITTTYFVPCSTGLSTSTVSVVTSFAGGKKVTYTPKLSVTTYTTSCPVEWGFGGVVTVTVPVTTTKTIISVKTITAGAGSGSGSGSGSGRGGSGSGNGSGSGSGNGSGSGSGNGSGSGSSNGSGNGSGNGNGSGSGSGNGSGSGSNNGNGSGSGNSNSNSNGSGNLNPLTPDATFKGPTDPAPTAGSPAASSPSYYYGTGSGSNSDSDSDAPKYYYGTESGSDSDSGSGSGSGSGSASPSASASGSSSIDWSNWSGSNVTSPIATFKGAAPRMGVSVTMVVVVAGVLGLML